MTDRRLPLGPAGETLLAELTDAAYRVALRHGVRGSSIDLQLEVWQALRTVLARERAGRRRCRQEVLS